MDQIAVPLECVRVCAHTHTDMHAHQGGERDKLKTHRHKLPALTKQHTIKTIKSALGLQDVDL